MRDEQASPADDAVSGEPEAVGDVAVVSLRDDVPVRFDADQAMDDERGAGMVAGCADAEHHDVSSVVLILAVIPAWRLVVAWSAGHPQLGVRERVLILGSGTQAIELARATLERRASGFHIVGFFCSSAGKTAGNRTEFK